MPADLTSIDISKSTRSFAIARKEVELTEKIKTTNNGYLFAPTPEDVYIALSRPSRFTVIYNPELESPYPIRIYNN